MKRIAALMLIVLLLCFCTCAMAQRVACPVGGFSLTLPDHFVEEHDPSDPELCFYWHGNKLTVLGYASWMGEVPDSDLFHVLDGSEQESGERYVNGMRMLYARTGSSYEISVMYSWLDRGNNVTLYFNYSPDDPSVQNTVDKIINSISFDAGH